MYSATYGAHSQPDVLLHSHP